VGDLRREREREPALDELCEIAATGEWLWLVIGESDNDNGK